MIITLSSASFHFTSSFAIKDYPGKPADTAVVSTGNLTESPVVMFAETKFEIEM